MAAPTFISEFGLPSTIGFLVIGNFSFLLILLVGSLYFVTFGIFSALSANVIGNTYISPFAPCTVVLNAYTAIIGIGMIGHLLHSLGMLILNFVMWRGGITVILWTACRF